MRMGCLLLVFTSACVCEVEVAPATAPALVINEVSTGNPSGDWFEVVNVGDTPIDLSDLVFVDRPGDFVRAHRMDDVSIAPGAHHIQHVSREDHGFTLGDADALWIHIFDDRALVHHVRWRRGTSRSGASYKRTTRSP